MKRIIVVALALMLSACTMLAGSKQPAAPRKVQTLAVLPVMVDVETINYTERDALLALLEETSRDVDDWLVEQLRNKGNYFDVRQLDEAPRSLLDRIIETRALVGDGNATRYDYSFNAAAVSELMEEKLVDGLLVVIMNGVTRPEKRWSSNSTRFEYLQTEYSSLLYTAAVLGKPAETLWARPARAGEVFLRLDYPDFDEAFWNRTKEVAVKEITLSGLERTLAEAEEGLFVKTTVPKRYNEMIRELVDQLKKGI